MRKKIIAGNWKMNKTFSEAEDFLTELTEIIEPFDLGSVEVIVCPPSLYLELASDFAQESELAVGAQNCSDKEFGAYTGEISAPMLDSMELEYCIVGHSERRQYYGETDESVNAKIASLLNNGITPIVCIGESLLQRENDETEKVILSQLRGAFHNIDFNKEILIAYEPIWAIGTGKTATPQQAQEIHKLIRNWLKDNHGIDVAEAIHILYGGSMKPDNVNELLKQADIDGGLIGGASLDSAKFSSMIQAAVKL
ncbi:MAG: triose-phosphate isomerase [Candidatus Cloacimonas sp. 4484_143]|nr:MAG: triose-phosphate isomerase [Candidatus Cloacimonas sp. 4484_143]